MTTAAIVGALLGLVLAPIVTMLIARPPLRDLPDGMVKPEPVGLPFRCASCGQPIAVVDVVPLLSFARLRGKCRSCHAAIGWHVPAAEVVTIGLLGLIGWRIGWHPELAAYLLFGAVCVPVIVTDFRIHRIATRLVYPAAFAFLALLALAAAINGNQWERLRNAGVGGLAASAFIWLLWLIYPAGMGPGDARVSLLLGMALGWHGLVHIYVGMLAGFLAGAMFGILLVIARRGGRKTQIAFGPYLCLGALLLSLWPQIAR